MSLDPNIALQVQPAQIQNPLAQYAQIAAIQDSQARNRLLDLTMQKTQREQTQADALNSAFSAPGALNADGSLNSSGILSSVAKAGAGSAIPALSKQLTDAQTAKLTQEKTQVDLGLQRFGALGQVLNGVTDQASYTAAIQHAAQSFGPQAVANIPAAYDPQFVAQTKAQAMTVMDQLKQHNAEIDQALAARVADETARHNIASEGTASGNLKVAQGNAAETARHNAATETQSRVPAGYRSNGDGSLSAIPGGPADKGANLNEGQAAALAFGSRAQDAQSILRKLEADGTTGPNTVNRVASALPGIGGAAGAATNWLNSDQQQSYNQAKSNFITAVLRKESGAVIGDNEFRDNDRLYFPQPGDSAATIAQKARSRDLAIEAIKAQAGPGAAMIPGVIQQADRDSGGQQQPAAQPRAAAPAQIAPDAARAELLRRAANNPALAAKLQAMGH